MKMSLLLFALLSFFASEYMPAQTGANNKMIVHFNVYPGKDNDKKNDWSKPVISLISTKINNTDSIYHKCNIDSIYNLEECLLTNKDSLTDGIYFVLGNLCNEYGLVYIYAKVYLVYSADPLKYMLLFEAKTKYYNKESKDNWETRLSNEFARQLKEGLDDKIKVVFKYDEPDFAGKQSVSFQKGVTEYIKSRLVMSQKIKVFDNKIDSVAGISQKPQYFVKVILFEEASNIHIVAHCIDSENDQIIISRQASYQHHNQNSLDSIINKIGDEFRNSILILYNNKLETRKKKIAIVPAPPLFTDPATKDVLAMQTITKKIVFSILSTINSDTDLHKNCELILDPGYYDHIEELCSVHSEPSVIMNDLNAEVLFVIQTIGNPSRFNLLVDKYSSDSGQSDNIFRETMDNPGRVKYYADTIFKNMLSRLDTNYHNKTSPSAFYRNISNKVGVRLNVLNSLNGRPVFLNNPYRPAAEIAGYYSSSINDMFHYTLDLSFIYDTGKFRDYSSEYPNQGNITGTVYSRNINFLFKLYLVPLYDRFKDGFSLYAGCGGTLVDIHTVSTLNGSRGSWEPGLIFTAGVEYNLSESLYIELTGRYMTAFFTRFNTLDQFKDTFIQETYNAFYIGTGAGYEFSLY